VAHFGALIKHWLW